MPAYAVPSFFFSRIINPVITFVVGTLGVNLQGAWVLAVRGRKSGKIQTVPVNVLIYQGARYLLSPRGETQWVRNLRAAGECELRRGRNRRTFRVAEEVSDADKPFVLQAYLQKWDSQTKSIIGLDRNATMAELVNAAPKHPAFRLIPIA